MYKRFEKAKESKNQSTPIAKSQMPSGGQSQFQFVDNRPDAVTQRKLQKLANNQSDHYAGQCGKVVQGWDINGDTYGFGYTFRDIHVGVNRADCINWTSTHKDTCLTRADLEAATDVTERKTSTYDWRIEIKVWCADNGKGSTRKIILCGYDKTWGRLITHLESS